jgi:hypothetical protein
MYKKVIEISIYWDGKVSISNVRNKGLHESLDWDYVIIHKIFFCNWKTFLLSDDLPQNIITYSIIEW